MHPPWPHPVFSDIPAHTGLRSAPPGRHREVVDEFAGGLPCRRKSTRGDDGQPSYDLECLARGRTVSAGR
jgi:hypothetical protein